MHLEATVRDLGGKLTSAKPEVLRGFWQAMFYPFGGQMQGSKQFWAQGPSLAILGPVKVSGSYSSASWGKVGGS